MLSLSSHFCAPAMHMQTLHVPSPASQPPTHPARAPLPLRLAAKQGLHFVKNAEVWPFGFFPRWGENEPLRCWFFFFFMGEKNPTEK